MGKKPKEATPDHGGRPRTAGTRIALDALPDHNSLTGNPGLHHEPVFVDGYSAGTPQIINQVGRSTKVDSKVYEHSDKDQEAPIGAHAHPGGDDRRLQL